MSYPKKIDLHMHSVVSDGTDTPAEILSHVRAAGIDLFSLTDHDAVKGCGTILGSLGAGDPSFIPGVEFSCKDEEGKYHILGYGYQPDSPAILALVDMGHGYRINKLKSRIDFLESEFGFTFPEEEIAALFAMDNPGKPHLGNLMVKYGYADTKESAIKNHINKLRASQEYVRPEEAIQGILEGGGIPVLAHPSYGNGDQLIGGEEMEQRLLRLLDFGLKGVEAFYSGFTARLRNEILTLAEKYNLYVTAGSDYHGKNKLVELADTGLTPETEYPKGLWEFLEVMGV